AGGPGPGAGGGGGGPGAPPPQYIITTPSEVDADEFPPMGDLDLGSPETQIMQSQKISSSSSTKVATRSYSMTSTSSSATGMSAMQQLQQQQQQHMQQTQKIISSSTRSQSLQSSAIVGEATITTGGVVTGAHLLGGGAVSAAALAQQLKAQSSTSIVTSSEQRTSTSTSSSSSTRYMASGSNGSSSNASASASATTSKSRFQSFLQQPEGAHGFLTAHQKHVRQFVRSTSAHSEAAAGTSSNSRPEKCIRSASTQIDDAAAIAAVAEGHGNLGNLGNLGDSSSAGGSMQLGAKLGLQQSSSILISKSAETIEMKSTSSAGMRTQLTLSGGFLAPPGNRKITILSPIHAPPGLHDMLKRSGRSPLSPRINFPGSETDLFG
ncbi:hypothetical protein KR009_002201, partial [Drosophila setifemur]